MHGTITMFVIYSDSKVKMASKYTDRENTSKLNTVTLNTVHDDQLLNQNIILKIYV